MPLWDLNDIWKTNATKSNKERKLFGIKQLQRYLEPRHPSSLHFLKGLGALKSLHYILCSQRKCDALHKKHVQQANGGANIAKTNHFVTMHGPCQTYRSFSWLITEVSNQAFSWMSSFCHEESQKHTIKTPRMHVDKNRIDAVSTTAVSLPKKLQPVRCKVSLALHLTYCTKSMCSRQMAVQT